MNRRWALLLAAALCGSGSGCGREGGRAPETSASPSPWSSPSPSPSPSPVPSAGASSTPPTTPATLAVEPAEPGDIEVEVKSIDTEREGGPLLLLAPRDGSLVLPIEIGSAEALAIAIELHGVTVERPLTHDLMRDLLAASGARLSLVRIVDLREGTFRARLHLRVGEREVAVDARPSDAIALALRTGAPVRVSAAVLEQAAVRRPRAPGEHAGELPGLSLQELTPALRRSLGVGPVGGVLVSEVDSATAADRSGLSPGDVILAVAGKPVASPGQFVALLRQAPGALGLSVLRRGKKHELTLARE